LTAPIDGRSLAVMSLNSLINDTFPGNRAPDGRVFVWTRRGEILAGKVRQCDDRGLVLDTAQGTVLIVTRSIVAISDKREALRPDHPPAGGAAGATGG